METREQLQRKIAVAGDLRMVVGTMKGIAAVTIRQFEEALAALEDYRVTVELGLQVALGAGRGGLPVLTERTGPALVVFGSDHGLCGSLNRVVIDEAQQQVGLLPPDTEHWVIAVGERLADELGAAGLVPAHRYRAPASAGAITELVQDLLIVIEGWAAQGRWVLLVTPRPTATATAYAPITHQLLPLDPDRMAALASRPWTSRRLPVVVGDPREALRSLTRSLIAVDLHRAVAETAVAVHRSRLAAMQAAERNIDERLEELHRSYHQVRQAGITEELLDVVSGFEVLQRAGAPVT